MRTLFAVTVVVLLTGCTTGITLKHADGRQAKCGPYFADGPLGHQVSHRESQCISDFQRQGYERVN